MTLPFAVLWASLATGLTILLLFFTHSLRPGAATDLVNGLGCTAAAYLLCIFLIARTHAGQQNLADLLSIRKTHPLPSLVPVPPPAWETPYAAMAREDQLGWATLTDVTRAVQSFLDPVLAGDLDGNWSPAAWSWSGR